MDLEGFADITKTENDEEEERLTKKTNKKKGGGFQSLGLSFNVMKGITKRGYKIPTPIQRKTIPLALEGRDLVAMARTGSGKTACFLIPMFEKLKVRSAKAGARALIMSPTRELAVQTLKFTKDLGKFTGLKTAVILGGDSMDDQFSAIHGNPDIIVATPGRFLHVCVEMDLKLNNVEYIVFDEADRLFEMGFGEQLNEILNRLPDSRQTVLFSATLPKVLVEFAKAGLSDPVLIRLDVESKLPDQLQLHFLTVRPEERVAALLVLLKSHINSDQQTVVFAATKYHVEYLHMVLDHAGVTNTYIYSNLDPSARKINTAKFSQGKVKVLVVTDVAARGIDIPQLDNVINYHFPAKSKLFLHRVGRCARAGRSGTAYSLVAPDEYAYTIDLHLFLGRPLTLTSLNNSNGNIGRIPQSSLEVQQTTLITLHETHCDLISMRNVSENAQQQYVRSRPSASNDSNKRVKELPFACCNVHPIFKEFDDGENDTHRANLLDQMKNYRPQGTIFEICGKNKSQDYIVMKEKRAFHKEKIVAHHQKLEIKKETCEISVNDNKLVESGEKDISETFKEIVLPKKRKIEDLYKKKIKKVKDDEHYIPYLPADRHTEEGLAVNNFQKEANKAQLDLTGDSEEGIRLSKQLKKWDRKKKKLVTVNDNTKMGKIKTESGVWIPATYKSNRYTQWKERNKADHNEDSDGSDNEGKAKINSVSHLNWAKHNAKQKEKQRRNELKTTDQIMKARKIADKKKQRSKKRASKRKGKKGK